MDRQKIERSIKGLSEWRKHVQAESDIDTNISTAIEALKAQLSQEGTTKGTTSDTISRQAAIGCLRDGQICGDYCRKAIEQLPPVQPEPHEGHWIRHETPDGGEQYECSRCGVLWEFNDGTPEDNEAYFCPKCGTKMKGVRHESY